MNGLTIVHSYLFLSILDSNLSWSTSIFFVDNCCCIAAIILLKALEMVEVSNINWGRYTNWILEESVSVLG